MANAVKISISIGADILADLKLDQESLIAAVLYRAVREGKTSLDIVRKQFGVDTALLIEGVLRMATISQIINPHSANSKFSQSQLQLDNMRKMLVAMIDDVRVALIKLAERTFAIRELKDASDERKKRVAREIFDIYAPLAHRRGAEHAALPGPPRSGWGKRERCQRSPCCRLHDR